MNYFQTPLFKNISEDEYEEMMTKNFTKKKEYKKSSFIFHAEDIISEIGLVTCGQVLIQHTDFNGNGIDNKPHRCGTDFCGIIRPVQRTLNGKRNCRRLYKSFVS